MVRDYVGHGIGRDMHEDPEVPNFGRPGRGPKLSRRYGIGHRTYGEYRRLSR